MMELKADSTTGNFYLIFQNFLKGYSMERQQVSNSGQYFDGEFLKSAEEAAF